MSTDVGEHLRAHQERLWTWTVQSCGPKSPPYTAPEDFVPFPLRYVELPGEIKVETRLVDVAPAEPHIGTPMELTIVPFETGRGDAALTFGCRPTDRSPTRSDVAIVGSASMPSAPSAQRSQAGRHRRPPGHAGPRHRLVPHRVRVRRLVGGRRRRNPRVGPRRHRRAVSSTSPTAALPRQRADQRLQRTAFRGCRDGHGDRFDKDARGAFDAQPGDHGIGDWHGETGLMLTTQSFRMKSQRDMTSTASPAAGWPRAGQGVPQRRANPNAWRGTPMSETRSSTPR